MLLSFKCITQIKIKRIRGNRSVQKADGDAHVCAWQHLAVERGVIDPSRLPHANPPGSLVRQPKRSSRRKFRQKS